VLARSADLHPLRVARHRLGTTSADEVGRLLEVLLGTRVSVRVRGFRGAFLTPTEQQARRQGGGFHASFHDEHER
jgi:hypothetical protein